MKIESLTRTLLACAAASSCLLSARTAHAGPVAGRSHDVILQAFDWQSYKYSLFANLPAKSQAIKDAGFTMVWLPPPQQSASAQGYLPTSYYTLSSAYGTETQLRTAVQSFKTKGLHVIADLVVNHRASEGNWHSFTSAPSWGTTAITSNDECWTTPGTSCTSNLTRGSLDTGDNYAPARDLDLTNASVIGNLKWWTTQRLMTDVGFDSFRFDYAKGYSGAMVASFNNNAQPYFSVAEYWKDLVYTNPEPHRTALVTYADAAQGTTAMFDFTTKGLLNESLTTNNFALLRGSDGRPAGLLGKNPRRAVTFAGNHDTDWSGNCGEGHPANEDAYGLGKWALPCGRTMLAYVYILTHPGIPTVYWTHYDTWNLKTDIDRLIALRNQQGVHSQSEVKIYQATTNLYAAVVNTNLAIKIGVTDTWTPPGSGWTLAASGFEWKVWTKARDWKRTVIFMQGNTVSGQDMFVRGGIDTTYAQNTLGRSCTNADNSLTYSCSIPVSHRNLRNTTTDEWKSLDEYLDWGGGEPNQGTNPDPSHVSVAQGTAADWTTNNSGNPNKVSVVGFGYDPLNTWGDHYWMIDVDMDCSSTVNGFFELKSYISGGPGWESNVSQAGAPYASNNHFAQCGKINVFVRGSSAVTVRNF